MDEVLIRIWENLQDRVSGPMRFRMILQPAMATVFAVMAGLRDARAGKPPYFWSLLSDPENRMARLKDGWQDVGKVFALALVLDLGYQFFVQGVIHPGEMLIVAILLALVPYLVVRGLATRFARLR
jgi:hypothetical protein